MEKLADDDDDDNGRRRTVDRWERAGTRNGEAGRAWNYSASSRGYRERLIGLSRDFNDLGSASLESC